MKALLLTNEYPPHIYGGAGVHVDYLSRELARLIDVEVRCFGDQRSDEGRLHVRGYGVDEQRFAATPRQLRSPLEALARCIDFNAAPIDADIRRSVIPTVARARPAPSDMAASSYSLGIRVTAPAQRTRTIGRACMASIATIAQ